MGHCFIHNQSYNENLGGFCPYCGAPKQETRTVSEISVCPECGHQKPTHFDGCSRKTSVG